MAKYLTAPRATTEMPKGIPYIIGNEAAERFSFYGMKAILFVFMTEFLRTRLGELDVMSDARATAWNHVFTGWVYFTPLVGAVIADAFLGKYRTIIFLSIVYCFGHLALAIDETRTGLVVGLTLIAIGAGGIKPCVSAHVGDQFGQTNSDLLPRIYAWFYFAINFGALLGHFFTPVFLHEVGPSLAFGVPGILMLVATVVFWMGRKKFVHIPPRGMAYFRESFSGEGLKVVLRLSGLYLFIAAFWSLFDQTSSRWVDQARGLDRVVNLGYWEFELYPSQIQFINPVFVLLFIPLFNFVIYPAIDRVFKLTPLRKISIGMFVAGSSFLMAMLIESWIVAGGAPSVWWQVLAFALLTAAEIMVSITGLEFSYTQAPKAMKSWVLALWLSSVAVGNGFTAGFNFFIENADGTEKLTGPEYYLFFARLMLLTAIVFVFVAKAYKP